MSPACGELRECNRYRRGRKPHRATHALRAPRRARRVEHRPARLGVVDVSGVLGGECVVVRSEPIDVTTECQQHRRASQQLGRRHEGVAEEGLGDDDDGLTVVDDVRDLFGSEMPVDRGESEATAQRSLVDLDELGPVAAHERDGVARARAETTERADELVRALVQLAERAIAVLRDHRHAIRRRRGVHRGGHAAIDELVPREHHGAAW